MAVELNVKTALITGAARRMTSMLALEFAPNIAVNAVAPGLILPPPGRDETYVQEFAHTVPLQHHGNPQDIADAGAFVIQSDFITGNVVMSMEVAISMNTPMDRIVIGMGSNIEGGENIREALRLLGESVRLTDISTFYREPAIGGAEEPAFYNGVVAIETDLVPAELKQTVLRRIEGALGRRRNANKYASAYHRPRSSFTQRLGALQ